MAAKKKKTTTKKEKHGGENSHAKKTHKKTEEDHIKESSNSNVEKHDIAEEVRESAQKSDEKSVSVDSLIVAFLAISLLINVYLIYQNGTLKGDVESLMNQLTKAGIKPTGQTTTTQPKNTGSGSDYDGDKVQLDFYVMSQCPYGTQVLDAIAPVLKEVGEAVDFNVDYIASKTTTGFSSLHGQTEVDGNIAELCLMKYYPDNYQYMDAIVCMDKNMRDIPNNWESCAKENNMDVAKLKTCIEGDEGSSLLEESIERTNNVGARGSPTIYLNGASYSGGRGERDFLRAICNKITGDKPQACADIPEDPKFTVIILNDKRCKDCDTTSVESQMKNMFPSMSVKKVDYSTSEGKKLYDETQVKLLPAYLFPEEVENTEAYSNIQRYLLPAGSYTSLRIGAEFDPTKEICDNNKDDTGNGKVDCDDEECKGLPACLTYDKPTITFFVMSYCPYGNQAEEGIEPVYQLLGDKAVFEPRYIYYRNYGGGGSNYCMDDANNYCGMHGIQEANQNIRENCVQEKYGIGAWFEFSLEMNKKCNSKNADTCWTDVAKDLGYDTEFIDSCYKNDYEKYASVDLQMSESWGASGSPTVFINGNPYKGGRTPEAYKTALCAEFDSPPTECSTKLAGDATPQAAAPSGQC